MPIAPTRRRRALAAGAALVALSAAACVPPPPPGPEVLDEGHADIAVALEAGALELHVHGEHDHDHGVADEGHEELDPADVVLHAKPESETTVPANPLFSFLGAPGAPIWVLPQVEDPELLYLGYATEEIADGALQGDEVELELIDVDGPGAFALYTVDGFGTPTVLWDSDDPAADVLTVSTGTHRHANWAFSAEGEYTVTLEARGTLPGGTPVSTGEVDVTFVVGPYPPA